MAELAALCSRGSSPDQGARDFYALLDRCFTTFEVRISEHTEAAYRTAFACAAATAHKNVVYLFRSERPVQRFVGASDILYIGQTKHSFQNRYGRSAGKHAAIQRNKHALAAYGPIRLSTCDYRRFGESLLAAENQLLWWYYQNHFEYPPFNYTRARAPGKKTKLPASAPGASN